MRMNRHMVMAGALVIALLATTSSSTPARADDTSHDGPPVAESVFASADLEAPTTYDGFGAWTIEGSFGLVTPIPASRDILVIDKATGRLARVDLDTSEVTLGDPVNGVTLSLTITPGATWVYAMWEASPNRLARFDRYSMSDLSLDMSFDIDHRLTAHVRGGFPALTYVEQVAALPGDESALLLITTFETLVVRNGTTSPSMQLIEYPIGLAVKDATTAYIWTRNEILEAALDQTGVTALVVKKSKNGGGAFGSIVDGVLVIGVSAYPLTDFVHRSPTPFERAARDPIQPLRYLEQGYPLGWTIFDSSGQPAVEPSMECATPISFHKFAGDGRAVELRVEGLKVWDMLRRCGSYGEFTPLHPKRLFDSRTGQGNGGSVERIGAGSTTRVKVHGLAGVPETGVESVVLNVTAVDQRGAVGDNYVTVWPAGYERPVVSSLNISNGLTLGNMVTVSTAAGGYVDVYSNAGTIDLVIDVMGYFASELAPSGTRFLKSPTVRLLDTRNDRGPVQAQETIQIKPLDRILRDCCDYTDSATAIVLNVTAIDSSAGGHFRIFPTGSPLPDASAMNFTANRTINRLVTVMLGPDNNVDLWNAIGSVHVTVDFVGAYVTRGTFLQEGRFVGLVPERLNDTRVDSPFPGDGAVTADHFLISPGYKSEISLVTNLTAVGPAGGGYMSAGPWDPLGTGESGTRLIYSSSLNYDPGSTIGNQAIIRADGEGEIAVYSSARSHFVLDLFGYYTTRD